jgi:hypothetical protein
VFVVVISFVICSLTTIVITTLGIGQGMVAVASTNPLTVWIHDDQQEEMNVLGLLDQLLGLEVLPQVEHLPRGQPQQAAHGEDGEIKDSRVGRLVGVSHFLFPLAHVREVLDDALAQVLQPLELHLERFELGRVAKAVVALGLDAVLGGQEDLVALSSSVGVDARNKADLEDVVVVGAKGKLALFGGLVIDKMLRDEVVRS